MTANRKQLAQRSSGFATMTMRRKATDTSLAEPFLTGALFGPFSGGKERNNEKESKSQQSAVSFGLGLKGSKLEQWPGGELLFHTQGGMASSLCSHRKALSSTCLSYLHLLLLLDTSMLAATFRLSSQSCRAEHQVRMKSLQPWSGSPGGKMTLTWKNLTEVASLQAFLPPLTYLGLSKAPFA